MGIPTDIPTDRLDEAEPGEETGDATAEECGLEVCARGESDVVRSHVGVILPSLALT